MEIFETGTARRLFLGAFCVAANVFLLGFALDAGISVVDDVARLIIGHPVAPFRNFVAELVVIASPIMILISIFVPHLPKRALLPPAIFALWFAFGAPGTDALVGVVGASGNGVFWSCVQAALAALSFGLVHRRTGEWLLRPARLPHKSHLVLRTIAALVATIIALPILIAVLWTGYLVKFMEEGSDHFIDVHWTGIDTEERVLTKNGKEVHLVGMMHFAEPRFYGSLIRSFDPRSLVLTEGVTDREELMTKSLSYENAASMLGLSSQPALGDAELFDDQKEPPKEVSPPAEPRDTPRFVNADVDLSDLSPTTRAFLEHVAALYGSRSAEELARNFEAIVEQAETTDIAAVMKEIVERRNERVLTAFDALESEYDIVYVPWGALHMPGLQKALMERGYALARTDDLRILTFGFAKGAPIPNPGDLE